MRTSVGQQVMAVNNKCSCGGNFIQIEGLEGYQCERCGAYVDTIGEPNISFDLSEQKGLDYSEEKMKTIRGVPVNRFIIGSESKGRIEISIPIFATTAEQKAIIDQQLSLLEYMKLQIANKNLDIMPRK